MRDILFRGFHPDKNGKEKVYIKGEWIKGYWIEDNGIFQTDNNTTWMCLVDRFIKVIPETVGQYTGLTDKNGKKIFEGDILRGYHYPYCSDGQCNYFAEIVWFDNCPAFGTYCFKNPKSEVRGISDGNTDYMEDWNSQSWQVIGNIHSNFELLEV